MNLRIVVRPLNGESVRKRMQMKMVAEFAGLMLLAIVASSCASTSSQTDILRMIADAKTLADHEAIAEYYDRQAAQAEGSTQLNESNGLAVPGDAHASTMGDARALRKDCPIL
jgi:hypothetical protein